MAFWKTRKNYIHELQPDEILLDVHNLPAFDRQQFEGRIEQPIKKRTLSTIFYCMAALLLIFVTRLAVLQIIRTDIYAQKSEANSLGHIPIIADRGIIYDRNGTELAWNILGNDTNPTLRDYIKAEGFANILGYVSYPARDKSGRFWQEQTVGKDGIESDFNTLLSGKNGTKLIETNVDGTILSESTVDTPVQGNNLSLTIDTRVQETLYKGIKDLADSGGYVGGAGALMDITTGELLAITSFPEYNQTTLAEGSDTKTIKEYLASPSRPFLNRMTEGLYTPGSIIKPFLALAAQREGIIDPNKIIYTTGQLRIPNPYHPGQFTVFRDNANHGAVDMRTAIAVSSNVYFYEIGGGYGDQQGLGIANIEKYARMFGIGEKTGISLRGELAGVVPSVAWKARVFPNDPWRIGDTYNTAIGQYGFQVTPIQILRAVGALANRGTLLKPEIVKNITGAVPAKTTLPFTDGEYEVVHEAMRKVVTEGTAVTLYNPNLSVAAKTGTAQIKNNTRVNSWAIGFFPYENPQFAFVVLMENGPKITQGATNAVKPVIDLFVASPELLTQL